MKKKISIKATIEKKNNLIKVSQRVDSDILLLEKKFALPTKKIIKNKPIQDLKSKPFVLEKKISIVENKKKYTDNIFSLNKNKNKTLQVQRVSKSLGNRPILKNISLTLEAGKIVGLLGPNGSGKTTLFNLIIGKIFPDHGSIIFDNNEIHNIPIHLRSLSGISLLEQHKGLFGNMTAGDNLFAILELHMKDKEKINQKIESLLGYFDLAYLKNTKADLLSGGEYKKVSILQRICNPNITTLLLDEPCAALDPLSINSLKEFILELKKAGLSILITDHNYWAIENILDKAYIVKSGEILVEGTTEKISKDKNAIKYYLGGNFRF
ncbi:ATP-binding cassette domain-containing protein [Pelagibacteraceae bacterium]|nr:ATP-binding cassette domain-containing protein [Pelagibacteraceae bacterium]